MMGAPWRKSCPNLRIGSKPTPMLRYQDTYVFVHRQVSRHMATLLSRGRNAEPRRPRHRPVPSGDKGWRPRTWAVEGLSTKTASAVYPYR